MKTNIMIMLLLGATEFLAMTNSACSRFSTDKSLLHEYSTINNTEQSKIGDTKIKMFRIFQALDAYRIQYSSYPTTEEGLQALVDKGVLHQLPKDGWGFDFEYFRKSSVKYLLRSLGADNQPGGKGSSADLKKEYTARKN